jgi:hypothetical protein
MTTFDPSRITTPHCYPARTLSVRFSDVGWATFTICEELRQLSVQSDWGDAAYGWGHGSLPQGKGFTETLRDNWGCSYLVSKLRRGHVELSRNNRLQVSPQLMEDYQEAVENGDVDDMAEEDIDRFRDMVTTGGWEALNFASHDSWETEWFQELCLADYVEEVEHPWLAVWEELLMPTLKHLLKESP